MTLAATTGVAQADYFQVNTHEDYLAQDATDGEIYAACAASAGTVAGGQVVAQEGNVNDALKDEDGTLTPADPANPPDKVDAQKCSFRMALMAARAFGKTEVPTPGTKAFDRISFSEELAGEDALPIDLTHIVDTPLPLIDEMGLVIDGCDHTESRTSATGTTSHHLGKPCVDFDLPAGGGGTASETALSLSTTVSDAYVPNSLAGLTVVATGVHISGIAFSGGDPAIYVPPPPKESVNPNIVHGKLKVTNSYFGMYKDGTKADRPYVGIQLSGNEATIGWSGADDDADGAKPVRNIFAAGEVGIAIAGGTNNKVAGNWFGVDSAGEPTGGLDTGVAVTGLGAETTFAADALRDGQTRETADTIEEDGKKTVATGNSIGASTSGSQATDGICNGPCNFFGGINRSAIDIGGPPLFIGGDPGEVIPDETAAAPIGARNTNIFSNSIGITDSNAAVRNGTKFEDAAVLVRNGSFGTKIGGSRLEANRIYNTRGAGVGVDLSAGLGTVFGHNTGAGNGRPIFDLGNDNVGNRQGISRGIEPPAITSVSINGISGEAPANATVNVYQAPGAKNGEIAATIGSATANAEGRWTLAKPLPQGAYVAATLTLSTIGTSELAPNVQVPAPPQPVVDTTDDEVVVEVEEDTSPPPPPPPPPPPADTDAPEVVTVFDKPAPAEDGGVVKVERNSVGTFTGQTADASGVQAVHVAVSLGVVRKAKSRKGKSRKTRSKSRKATTAAKKKANKKKKRAKKRKKVRRCRWVHLRKAKVVKRRCDRPLFFKARGTTDWTLPTNRRVRRMLKRRKRMVMFVRAADTQGNFDVKRYRVKVVPKKKMRS